MNIFPAEVVFLGDAAGQPAETTIGGCRYLRGEVYRNVPAEHYSKGGFHITGDVDGVMVVHKTPARRGVVLGSAPGLWVDLMASNVGDDWEVIAVNRSGVLFEEKLSMWASIHGSSLNGLIEQRAALGRNMAFDAYGNYADNEYSGDVIRWNRPNGGGSSGLFAVMIALELGFTKLILCGMPMDGDETLNEKDEVEMGPTPYAHYRKGWEQRRELLSKHVRSMSGWTRETFGAPTAEWLNE